jgi:putative transferase (TIGR04331 family)
MQQHYFLATTALKEFWDVSKPLLFLGEWCLHYSEREQLVTQTNKIAANPWDNVNTLNIGREIVEQIYKGLLPKLAAALNNIHKKNHSLQFWQIILGPWLYLYVSVIYERYLTIATVLQKYPDLETVVLNASDYICAENTDEFVENIKTDFYNLQLYSRCFTLLGKFFPEKSFKQNKQIHQKQTQTFRQRVKTIVALSLHKLLLLLARKNKILLASAYLCKSVLWKLFWQSNRRLVPFLLPTIDLNTKQLDLALRAQLNFADLATTEFGKVLFACLPLDIPKCYVEQFTDLVKHVAKLPTKVSSILSANLWYYHETFKYWAAMLREKGTKLLGVQHGGNYGQLLYHPSEDHELNIVDYYYTWGWQHHIAKAVTIPMPVNILTGMKTMGASNNKVGVLWCTTSTPRYMSYLQYKSSAKDVQHYYELHSIFYTALNEQIKNNIRIRPHREDLGWDVVARIKSFAPTINIEEWNITFLHSLTNCRLYVCDHLSTTYLEALALNKPTVLFWESNAYELKKAAIPGINLLKAAGILYDTPEAAAKTVNDVYNDVESWWNNTRLQALRLEFCDQYAKFTPNGVAIWLRELIAQI